MKFKREKVARFQEQDCSLTLRQALDEFYQVNTHLFSPPEPKTQWTELLVHHDVAHVFFGVNTTIMDETAGDYWSLFATDMTFNEYLAYTKTPEGKKLIKEIGLVRIIKALFCSLPMFLRIVIRSRKMTRKWSLRGYENWLDSPLAEVREKHRLKILAY